MTGLKGGVPDELVRPAWLRRSGFRLSGPRRQPYSNIVLLGDREISALNRRWRDGNSIPLSDRPRPANVACAMSSRIPRTTASFSYNGRRCDAPLFGLRLMARRGRPLPSFHAGLSATSRCTGLWSVLATGDHNVACLMSAARVSRDASASS